MISLLAVLLAAGANACRVSYLAHLGMGQMHTLRARELLTPERVAQLDGAEAHALQLLRDALAFGRSLGLVETTSYRHLIDRAEIPPVRVVVAAPPDRLEPVTWWFPITGRISYRGFFTEERAQRFAARLASSGYDVYQRPAALYSTLGFFDDPIPSEMLRWDALDVVDTIIHELVHETVFVSGDLEYNEALATFIGRRATLAFFAGRPELTARARAAFEDADRFAALLERLGAELSRAYARVSSPEEARRVRGPIFERYQRREHAAEPWRTARYAGFVDIELSNAYLVANRTYLGALPCFQRELEALDGDLRAFVAAHIDRPGHHQAACDGQD